MRTVRRMVLLVALWLLAWGEVTLANVISGAAVAAGLLVAFPPVAPPRTRPLGLNPLGVARLAGYIARQLVTSNIVMTREILRRRAGARPGVLAHRLEVASEEVVTIMTSVIALSPGTMTVDVDRGSTTIYVHFLFLREVEAARASLERLEQLAVHAITARPRRGLKAATQEDTP